MPAAFFVLNNIVFTMGIKYSYRKNIMLKGDYKMSNKFRTTKKEMTKLGIKKTKTGDYEYIDPKEKFGSISCRKDSINTVEGEYNILVCKK